ncbi:MAG: DUF2298 domain-containing protein [Chloroflexota bacterium]|nr:DUF2298 domain-containing protein [Chloroflexota bacterium]
MKRFLSFPHHRLILLVVLLAALALRLIGINWDQGSRMHPDERFMATVSGSIGKPQNLRSDTATNCPNAADQQAYFNTQCSVLNPNNVINGSYVYGTLPLFLVHLTAQGVIALNPGSLENAANWQTYDYVFLVGRFVNALADTLSVLMLYLIGRRLFSRQHGLLAAALYAFAALPIQLSHFWTVDIQSNLFVLITLYAAIEITLQGRFWGYALFGIALAAGLASRINLYPLAALLPLALLLRYWAGWIAHRESAIEGRYFGTVRRRLIEDGLLALFAIALSLVAFRVFQPYGFIGPTLNNWTLDQEWISELISVSNLSRIPSDNWPPGIQWFGRVPYVYPWVQMILWGTGIGLGLAGTLALVAAVIMQIRRRKPDVILALLVIWVLGYFASTGGIHLMTMRYFLPLYGVLALLGSWGIFAIPRQRLRRAALIATAATTTIWGIAFINIYLHPFTRIEASRWIESNIPGTVTLLSSTADITLARVEPTAFSASMMPAWRGESYLGEAFELAAGQRLSRLELRFTTGTPVNTSVQLLRTTGEQDDVGTVIYQYYPEDGEFDPNFFVLTVPETPALEPGTYRWRVENNWEGGSSIRGYLATHFIQDGADERREPVIFRHPYQSVSYIPIYEQQSLEVRTYETTSVTQVVLPHVMGDPMQIVLELNGSTLVPATRERRAHVMGDYITLTFEPGFELQGGVPLRIISRQPIFITGSLLATEGQWDDSVPLLYCDYRPTENVFENLVGGLHQSCDGIQAFARGHYVELPMQMATADSAVRMQRLKFVLAMADYFVISSNRFYDSLPRMPVRYASSTAYYDALFGEQLGYTLAYRAMRLATILGISLPHQALPGAPRWLNELEAEEAFTVYDHPTVMVYRNDGFVESAFPAYVPFVVAQRGYVDLATLPGATFTLNTQPLSDADVWGSTLAWLVLFVLLGWVSYPVIYMLFPTAPWRGFAIARGLAWLGTAFLAWFLTAIGASLFWTRGGVILLLLAWVGINAVVLIRKRQELVSYIREHARAFVWLEVLFLVMVLFGLLLRAVSPELWAINLGGEKPMDFAYLNAVLRTPVFPPPNPWFANFEINYYYFGFVIAALPIKLLGTASEIGYNLSLGMLYGAIFMVVFTIGYMLVPATKVLWRVLLALVGSALALLAGNLGTLQMLIARQPNIDPHRWFWYPTRVLAESANSAGGAINEVPLFSFLFGDLHAHVVGLLPTMLMLFVMLVMYQTRQRWTFVLLGVLSAIILMTNTWDVFLYVPLGALAVWLSTRSLVLFIRRGILVAAGGVLAVAPFLLNFSSGAANGIDLWTGERSLIEPWLIVWGIPVTIALFWLSHRARAVWFPDARVPLELGILGVFVVAILVPIPSLATTVLCALLVAFAILLALRDEPPHRFAHAGIAICVGVLLLIEYIVVRNDVQRMNTVFKTSFHIWIWFALLMPVIFFRLFQKGNNVGAILGLGLIGMGLLYPVGAITGRWALNQSGGLTLDGNRFIETISLPSGDALEDRALIYFMRQSLPGFPIIAEWYEAEYRWNSRISVQTGLPAVVGWANHMRQQYSYMTSLVQERIADMQSLYRAQSIEDIRVLLERYAIDYIVVGQLERSMGDPLTLSLFEQMVASGELKIAYSVGTTMLYEVVQEDSTAP